ncbi:phosphatase PAP2 family protein [Streptomyces erythrochromogenes]|uniref:phosphatase PAP2 family protein n=1 Tax=Streptomyces erythrochromogenes TaxID=285574 RepID=UPI00367A049E
MADRPDPDVQQRGRRARPPTPGCGPHGGEGRDASRPWFAAWLAEPLTRPALALIAGATAVMVAAASGAAPLLHLDRALAEGLHRLALGHPSWTRANRILTDWVWDPWTVRLLIVGAVAVLWLRRRRTLALWVAGTCAVEWTLRAVLRWAIGRPRPVWEDPVDSASFASMPSGHAMTMAAGSVLLLWLARQGHPPPAVWILAVTAAAVSVAGVAFTRMYLGVHWPSDTVAGVLLGSGLSMASLAGWKSAHHPRSTWTTPKP